MLEEGALVKGIVQSLVPGRGAVISLAHGARGMVSVTDFCDDYDEGNVKVGDFIKCKVVRLAAPEKGYPALSCRKSRSVPQSMSRCGGEGHLF